MKLRRILLALGSVAAAVMVALGYTSPASAAITADFGKWVRHPEPGGAVGMYKVSLLAPSRDWIPYQVRGRLYEALVDVGAYRGDVTPVIPYFAARAANGDTYPGLAVATNEGLSPATLNEGGRSMGRVYFDVVGAPPNSVIYTDMTWVGDVPDVMGPPTHNPMMPHDTYPVIPPPPLKR